MYVYYMCVIYKKIEPNRRLKEEEEEVLRV